MIVELITCKNSPECNATKMFLDMRQVEYEHREVTHEEMEELGVKEVPLLFIDYEVRMVGFDPQKLSKLFE